MKSIKSILALSVLAAAGSANATTWNLDLTTNTFFPAASGNVVMTYQGTWDDVTNKGVITGVTTLPGFAVVLNISNQAFTMDETTGVGSLPKLVAPGTCTDNSSPPGASCGAFTNVLKGPLFNNIGGGGTPSTSTGSAFVPVDGGTYVWSAVVTTLNNDTGEVEYPQLPLSVTLHSQVPVPAAAWLFGSGLLGLAGTARRRRTVTPV